MKRLRVTFEVAWGDDEEPDEDRSTEMLSPAVGFHVDRAFDEGEEDRRR